MNEKKRLIPSEEELANAKKRMRERSRNLEVVRNSIFKKFSSLCNLDNIYVIAEGDFQFRILVFFTTNVDLEESNAKGVCHSIQDFAYGEIERVGRGKPDEVMIEFEFDSDENVKKNFEGSYWFRLH